MTESTKQDAMKRRGRRGRHWLVPAAITALATIVLTAAACGGGSSNDAAASPDAAEKALRWAACMRENGAVVPDPHVDENGRLTIDGGDRQQQEGRSPAYAKAMAACQELFDQIRPPGASKMSPEARERFLRQALRYARCMRKHCIPIPDPSLTREQVAVSLPNGVDPSSPGFKKATAACGQLPGPTSD